MFCQLICCFDLQNGCLLAKAPNCELGCCPISASLNTDHRLRQQVERDYVASTFDSHVSPTITTCERLNGWPNI